MGLCSSRVDHAKSQEYMQEFREKLPEDTQTTFMAIRENIFGGRVYLCGPTAADEGLLDRAGKALQKSARGVTFASDIEWDDAMWDAAWHDTKLTSGSAIFGTTCFFPRGKLIVDFLDSLAKHGWVPTSGPNFGGPIERTAGPNVGGPVGRTENESSVSWPALIFKKTEGFTKDTLFMAIKDQGHPGKLCIAGPPSEVANMKVPLLTKLQKSCGASVSCEFDKYTSDKEWNAVYMHTSFTTGASLMSLAKPYFPKGTVLIGFIEEVYKLGWRMVAAPNFGGQGCDWPCFIFRKLINPPSSPPQLVMAAIKDQNMPGKVCFAGSGAQEAAQAVHKALNEKTGQASNVEKDKYDTDFDQVIRNTTMTTGMHRYFPESGPTVAMLNAMNELGYNMAAAPNFGGDGVSWPTFFWEKRGESVKSAIVAIRDETFYEKVCIGGVGKNKALAQALREGFAGLTLRQVDCALRDEGFDMAFRNTTVTTGASGQGSWVPYGFAVEMVVTTMALHGYKPVGGPNFGGGNLSWPCIVFEISSSFVPAGENGPDTGSDTDTDTETETEEAPAWGC